MKEARFLTIDSLQVRYFDNELGDTFDRAETVVLLHGFCGSSEVWELVFDALAERFRVVCIDLPGHGETECIPGMHDLMEVARWLNRVIAELDLTDFSLLGHSLGGYLSLAYLEQFPKRVKGLGLIHSTALPDEPERSERRDRVIAFVEEKGSKAFIRSFVPTLVNDYNPMMLQRLLEIAYDTREEAIIAFTEAMRDRVDRRFILEGAEIPVLFLAGEADELISSRQTREEKLLVKNGVLVALPGIGHMSMMESADECSQALVSFVSRVKIGQR